MLVGCTVVLKPSEVTPINAYLVAEAVHEAGLPPGVFNMVVGNGPECGEALSLSDDVDLISFTGSTRAVSIRQPMLPTTVSHAQH
jgi:aldehyde dehydrogenase (NAD+)